MMPSKTNDAQLRRRRRQQKERKRRKKTNYGKKQKGEKKKLKKQKVNMYRQSAHLFAWGSSASTLHSNELVCSILVLFGSLHCSNKLPQSNQSEAKQNKPIACAYKQRGPKKKSIATQLNTQHKQGAWNERNKEKRSERNFSVFEKI